MAMLFVNFFGGKKSFGMENFFINYKENVV